jgi:Protein of unknown function (DUF2793)
MNAGLMSKKEYIGSKTYFQQDVVVFEDEIGIDEIKEVNFAPYHAKIFLFGFAKLTKDITTGDNVALSMRSSGFIGKGWVGINPSTISNFGSIIIDEDYDKVEEVYYYQDGKLYSPESKFKIECTQEGSYSGNVKYIVGAVLYDENRPQLKIGSAILSKLGSRIIENKITASGYDWVIDKDLGTPPVSPTTGDAYIIPSGATGDWSSHVGKIATYGESSWGYAAPDEGDIVYVQDEKTQYTSLSAVWTNTTDVAIKTPLELEFPQNYRQIEVYQLDLESLGSNLAIPDGTRINLSIKTKKPRFIDFDYESFGKFQLANQRQIKLPAPKKFYGQKLDIVVENYGAEQTFNLCMEVAFYK